MNQEQLESVIKLAQQGDQKALGELIDTFAESVHGFIYHIIGRRNDVEDLAQDTFIKMISGINYYQPKAPFRAWLFRITLNVCRDYMRKKKVRNIVSFITQDYNDEKDIVISDSSPNPEKEMIIKDSMEQLEKAVQQLPYPLKTVFLLRDVQELSYEEIAETLNWQLGTVKSRLFRARNEIAQLLNT